MIQEKKYMGASDDFDDKTIHFYYFLNAYNF